jgi:hypothetical protein
MPGRSGETWLRRLFFVVTAALGLALPLAVLLTPSLVADPPHETDWQLLLLFARDAVVRRTAVVSGVGLLVTAFVFFRAPTASEDETPKRSKRRPPDRIAGA